ncbi:hypothetical protein DFH09DRAFT_1043901 [Mycena vulgaris]|nr:hypothetical protein DFH09DRAFT_1043901 [Mycena vulgaris]
MKYASRKYIDLIQVATSKWASWDPPHPIKVGDYGTVDKATGQFEKDGNIYDDAETAALAAGYPPQTIPPDEKMVITSETTQGRDFSLSPEVQVITVLFSLTPFSLLGGRDVPGLAEASIKGQWKFKTGKTGALLVMAKPRSALIANGLLKHLVDIPALKNKYLVTETVSCHAYSMYLSSKSEDSVSLALLAKTPLPVAPLFSAGGEIAGSWWCKTGAGVFRHGAAPPGTDSFTPLFALKRIRKKGFLRGPQDDDQWADAETPWELLDEDGEEEPFEDAVFD